MMTIKNKPSKNQAKAIQQFLLAKIPSHPHDITAFASEKFTVSRMTIHRHLDTLLKRKQIFKTGTTKNTAYFSSDAKNKKLILNTTQKLDDDVIWKQIENDFKGLKTNIYDICG